MDAGESAELERRREAAQAVFAALFKAQEAAAAAAHASGAGTAHVHLTYYTQDAHIHGGCNRRVKHLL